MELEHLATNEKVAGSSPSVFTNFLRSKISDLKFQILNISDARSQIGRNQTANRRSQPPTFFSGSSNRQDDWL